MTQVMTGESGREPGDDEDAVALGAARVDPDAFRVFYERNHQWIMVFFYRRTFCPHTSAELCAETFAQAWTSLKRFDPQMGTGRAWLFGIAGNLYKQWLRKGVVREQARRRIGLRTPELTEDDLARIDEMVDTADLRDALQTGLGQLTAPVRDAVLMRVGLDLPYPQVAELLGCSIGAARVRVTRGLHTLAGLMEAGT